MWPALVMGSFLQFAVLVPDVKMMRSDMRVIVQGDDDKDSDDARMNDE